MNDLKEYLLNVARQNDIEVYEMTYQDDATDVAFPFIRKIMMNIQAETSYTYEFRLAHEISHILYGKRSVEPYYRFSTYLLKGEERTANIYAVKLIAKFMYADVPIENRNWLNFMNQFGLQSQYEPIVRDVLAN